MPPLRPTLVAMRAAFVVATLVAGCEAARPDAAPIAAPSATAPAVASPPRSPSPAASPDPVATSASPTPAPAATALDPASVGPPAATLAAEGGDPVPGSLGPYRWGDSGSDSPWLQGAPIAVGEGEPLTVAFDPAIPVDSWAGRLVPAGSDGPADAVVVGQGVGMPTFTAPRSGSWTLELRASFGGGAGEASWFWRLDVP